MSSLNHNNFLGTFAGIAFSKNWKSWSNPFSPCPSLPSIAIDDSTQFQCLNMDLATKLDHYFLIQLMPEDKC